MGRDPDVDHLTHIYKGPDDSKGVHRNVGILNKAAYLITEGGEHSGVIVRRGIGSEKMAKVYMSIIKKLKDYKDKDVSFTVFRDLVVRTAAEVLPDQSDQQTVIDGFRAVGL